MVENTLHLLNTFTEQAKTFFGLEYPKGKFAVVLRRKTFPVEGRNRGKWFSRFVVYPEPETSCDMIDLMTTLDECSDTIE